MHRVGIKKKDKLRLTDFNYSGCLCVIITQDKSDDTK